MSLTLVLGPMKSGKSLEIINHISPLQHTRTTSSVYQSDRHGRDKQLLSRSGGALPAKKVRTLRALLTDPAMVIAIDEIHMFSVADVAIIRQLLDHDKRSFVVSGLDTDIKGNLFKTVKALLELGPDQVIYKKAACEVCHHYNAVYTQVLKDGRYVLTGPVRIPDDGTGAYHYEPRCRRCFVVDGR